MRYDYTLLSFKENRCLTNYLYRLVYTRSNNICKMRLLLEKIYIYFIELDIYLHSLSQWPLLILPSRTRNLITVINLLAAPRSDQKSFGIYSMIFIFHINRAYIAKGLIINKRASMLKKSIFGNIINRDCMNNCYTIINIPIVLVTLDFVIYNNVYKWIYIINLRRRSNELDVITQDLFDNLLRMA